MTVDWLQRWADNRIAFHQQNINSRLTKLWPTLGVDSGSTVFVPLCGKSADMIWLKDQGHHIVGNELSDIACQDFFTEQGVIPALSKEGKFTRFADTNTELLQGDFFDLEPGHLRDVHAVFDRAALIALPEPLRASYAGHMADILDTGTRILLITMAYDESKMNGPPFSVCHEEVMEIFGSNFETSVISESSGPEIVGNLTERGLDTLEEKVYLMQKY